MVQGNHTSAQFRRMCCSQSVRLQTLAIYFDCDIPLLDPGKRWDLITRERWDELLLPASHTMGCSAADTEFGAVYNQASTGQPHKHQFLLCPVDGTLHYVRRGKQARLLDTDAEQEIHLQLKHISVRLHQLQYQSSQKLLQEFDRYAASAPHRNLRPHCRPAAGKNTTVVLFFRSWLISVADCALILQPQVCKGFLVRHPHAVEVTVTVTVTAIHMPFCCCLLLNAAMAY